VKRHPHLQPLSDDHHGALVLARRVGRAARGGGAEELMQAWSELQRRFARELEPHFRVEEQWLLPPLEAVGERARVEQVRAEHRELRALASRDPDPAVAAQLAALLQRHVRFEERELFPCAQRHFDPTALEAVGRAARASRGERSAAHARAPGDAHPGAVELARQLAESVRRACIEAALAGYERASISGLCHEGAWEAAVSAIRMVSVDALVEAAGFPQPQAPTPAGAGAGAGPQARRAATPARRARGAGPRIQRSGVAAVPDAGAADPAERPWDSPPTADATSAARGARRA
jgi:hypothetical protein